MKSISTEMISLGLTRLEEVLRSSALRVRFIMSLQYFDFILVAGVEFFLEFSDLVLYVAFELIQSD